MSQHPVDQNIVCADQEGLTRSPEPPGKTQVIWDSIGNKQLDPPRKSWIPQPWKKCWSPSGTSENYESKQGCKDQESTQSSTTPDPGYQWESDKLTEDTTNESQEVSPFPAGDHKAHINRRAQNIANTRQNKNIKDPQKKYRLGTVSKIFYWRA